IIGTFAVMAALGFSLNNLTLFGLVLAIGIVVDDAIVVVEAVEHHIENGLTPRHATLKAMEQVSGPVIAVGLVLSAVFIPCAFISGITGAFFRQFALTIAVSTIISAFNSLTLSPALAALLLRPRGQEGAPPLPRPGLAALGAFAGYVYLGGWMEEAVGLVPGLAHSSGWLGPLAAAVLAGAAAWIVGGAVNWLLSHAFRAFNTGFRHATHGYTRGVGGLLRASAISWIVYGGLLGLPYGGFVTPPRGFIPSQDMGYLMVAVQLPDSASTERTAAVMRKLDLIARKHPAIRHATAITGQSFALSAAGPNFGSMFINLGDYADRRHPKKAPDPHDPDKEIEFEMSRDAIAN